MYSLVLHSKCKLYISHQPLQCKTTLKLNLIVTHCPCTCGALLSSFCGVYTLKTMQKKNKNNLIQQKKNKKISFFLFFLFFFGKNLLKLYFRPKLAQKN
jgi:hypothetical protein